MEIVSIATGIASAVGVAKNLTGLHTSLGDRVPTKVREQINAVLVEVTQIQASLVAAQQRETQLTDRCRELEGEFRRITDWESIKARYTLTTIDGSAFVYTLKPQHVVLGTEPQHWLCATCFEDGKKSHLQGTGRRVRDMEKWGCPRCDTTVVVGWSTRPGS